MWAARRHGCRLLNSTSAERGVLFSADALCELLPHCGEGLCKKALAKSLGREKVYDQQAQNAKHSSPLLPAERTVKLLTCLRVKAPSCTISENQGQELWHYFQGSVSVRGFGWQIPIHTLLQQADKLGNGGLALLQEIRKNLDVDDALDFDEHAAQEVWKFSSPSSDLLATLAVFDDRLPELLLLALMQSLSGKVPPVTAKLQARLLL